MSEKYNIEELLIKKLEGLEIEPSGNAWLKTQRMLRRKQFMRFQLRRMNIFYAAALVLVGVGISILILNEPSEVKREALSVEREVENNSVEVETGAVVNEGTKKTEETPLKENANTTIVKQEEEAGQEEKAEEVSPTPNHEIISSEENEDDDIVVIKTMITYFTPSVSEGCAPLEVEFVDLSENAVDSEWIVDGVGSISGKSFTFNNAGEYKVSLKTVAEDGNVGFHSEVIMVYPRPTADFEIEEGNIYNYSTDATEYNWSTERKSTISNAFQPEMDEEWITNNRPGRIFLTVENNFGCIDTMSAVLPLPPSPALNFPTAFSPNPSGPSSGYYNSNEPGNEIFHPRYNEEPVEYHLTIYNRAGELIFQTKDINIGWDGYFKEAPVLRGVYVWKCTGKWKDGRIINQQGDITTLWSN